MQKFFPHSKLRFFFHGATAPSGHGPPHYRGFTITFRHTTLGRTPLDEGSARRRDLYLTTHNTHTTQTSVSRAGFKHVFPASKRPQTHALHRAATRIGTLRIIPHEIPYRYWSWSYRYRNTLPNLGNHLMNKSYALCTTCICITNRRS
jgi:hypothetical protein